MKERREEKDVLASYFSWNRYPNFWPTGTRFKIVWNQMPHSLELLFLKTISSFGSLSAISTLGGLQSKSSNLHRPDFLGMKHLMLDLWILLGEGFTACSHSQRKKKKKPNQECKITFPLGLGQRSTGRSDNQTNYMRNLSTHSKKRRTHVRLHILIIKGHYLHQIL